MSLPPKHQHQLKIKRKFDRFEKIIKFLRARDAMNSPAACWVWVQVWNVRYDDEKLDRMYADVVAWGISDLYRDYLEFVRGEADRGVRSA